MANRKVKKKQIKSPLRRAVEIERSEQAFGAQARRPLPEISQALVSGIEIQGIDVQSAKRQLEQADAASQRLIEILDRCRELASEAAQEKTGLSRRVILQAEADKLVEEYNRIVKATDFTVSKRVEYALNKANN